MTNGLEVTDEVFTSYRCEHRVRLKPENRLYTIKAILVGTLA